VALDEQAALRGDAPTARPVYPIEVPLVQTGGPRFPTAARDGRNDGRCKAPLDQALAFARPPHPRATSVAAWLPHVRAFVIGMHEADDRGRVMGRAGRRLLVRQFSF